MEYSSEITESRQVQPVKILNVNMSIDSVLGGGTAERTVQMSRFLSRYGHECTILTLDIGLTPERIDALSRDRVKVVALPCLIRRFYVPIFSFSKVQQLVADSDIIHLMSHWTFLNALVYYCARSQKKPYVVCPSGSLPIFGRLKLTKKIFNAIAGNRMNRNASRCIACAPREIPYLVKCGANKQSISIIPNGICVEDYLIEDNNSFRRAYGLSDAPIILFVGRLNPIKGPDMLLRAFCAARDKLPHQLVLAGSDGGMLRELEDIVRNEDVNKRVHFLGHISGIQKSMAYNAADILVIPSRSEPLPIVLLEAGAAATAVLITDQCGFNDIADIGGGLVVPATTEGIMRGLINILAQPREPESMGKKLHQYTKEHFSWDRVVHKYINLYEHILSERIRS